MVPVVFYGLVGGLITAISPCVLPVLPIVLGGGATGSRRRPFAIIAGLALTFLVSVLFATVVLDALGLPKDLLRNVSIGLLFLIAAILVVPQLGVLIERPLSRLSRRPSSDLGGGFLLGCALGFVFVPCAGPALAFVTSSAASHQFGLKTFLTAIAYTVGVSIVLVGVALGGRRVSTLLRTGVERLRVVFGLVLAASALALVFNLDTKLQTWFPDYTTPLQKHTEASTSGLKAFSRGTNVTDRKPKPARETAGMGEAASLPNYGPAPDFAGISAWFNTKPLTVAQLRGQVVLVDFWTYSCINCLRTLPHLEAWDKLYRKDGLVIVGVHTPEFPFEAVPSNVGSAVKRLGIHYAVALDPNYDTWNRYGNQYWPADYLVDRQGNIRAGSFGEGEYAKTEENIRRLLGLPVADPAAHMVKDLTPSGSLTPETYLGIARSERYVGSAMVANKLSTYSFPSSIGGDEWAYAGQWNVGAQKVVAGPGARLRLTYHARRVYIVLGGKGTMQVLVNGKLQQTVPVTTDKLYTVVNENEIHRGLLELRFTPGVDAYSFTFG